jgi:glycosyltransferase involved in cell wall biosynthesis
VGARVVPARERGYGSALLAGIGAAKGKFIIMGDADGSYDFSAIDSFVERLRDGDDLAMGCRLPWGGGRIMPGAMPWKHKWIGNPVLSFIGRFFFRSPVTDFHCGLRGFRTQAIRKLGLQTKGMEFASEMVIKATMCGLHISEVPITLYKDGRSRRSHLRSWRDGWRHLRFMLLFSPRWLFFAPGLALALAGAIVFFSLLPGPISMGGVNFETNTMLVAAMSVMLGVQLMFFGVFTRLYSWSVGLVPEHPLLRKLLRVFSLERGVLAGAILFAGGCALLYGAVARWNETGFGDLSHSIGMGFVIPSITLMLVGAQLVFGSFFLGILELQGSELGRARSDSIT